MNVNVNINGYQTFYGVENTINNQQKIIEKLQQLNPSFSAVRDISSLPVLKELYKHALEKLPEHDVVEMIYPVHPEFLEVLSRVKTGPVEYTITRAKMKKLIKQFEEMQGLCVCAIVIFVTKKNITEKKQPTVKFIDEEKILEKRRKTKTEFDPNDIFVVNFD